MKMAILKRMKLWKHQYLEFTRQVMFVKNYLRQIVTATGDGSVAAQAVQQYIEELKDKLNVKA